MAETLGELLVRLGIDGVPLEQGAANAGKSLTRLNDNMAGAVAMGNILADVITSVAKSLVAMVPDALNAIDAQAKLAHSMGGTVAATDALAFALDDAGVDASKFEQAMKFMNRTLGDAIIKGGPAADAFEKLGLNARQLTQMDLDERFALIADAIGELGTAQERASAAADIFGAKAGNDLVNALDAGGESIRAARKELQSYGAALSEIDVANVERANDAMARIHKVTEGFMNRVVVKLAPYLEVLAEKFKALAVDTHGFQVAIDKSFSFIMEAIGFLGDSMRGFQVIFKGAELVAQGFAATIVSAFELSATVVAAAIDNQIESVNGWIRALNMIPGVDIGEVEFKAKSSEFVTALHAMGDEARNAVGTIRDELDQLAQQPLPSENIKKFLEDVESAANKASEAVVAAQAAKNQGVSTGETDEETKAREKAANDAEILAQKKAEQDQASYERYREHLQLETLALEEKNMTDLQLMEQQYADELALLQIARGEQLITEQDFQAQMEATTARHQDNLKNMKIRSFKDLEGLTKLSWQTQASILTGTLAQMTAGLSRENRAMFEINKAAAIGNAALNAADSVLSAFRAGCQMGGPYVGAAFAAAAGIFAATQIAAIAGTSFGGGGGGGSSAPSIAGSTAAPPVSAVQSAPSQVMSVQGLDPGSIFTGDMVRQFAGKLVDFQRDGGTVVFA